MTGTDKIPTSSDEYGRVTQKGFYTGIVPVYASFRLRVTLLIAVFFAVGLVEQCFQIIQYVLL